MTQTEPSAITPEPSPPQAAAPAAPSERWRAARAAWDGLNIKERLDRPVFRWIGRLAHIVLIAGVAVYLLYRLSELGWAEVWRALPASPWFYILFALRFAALPLFELLIYQRLWRTPLWRSLPVFIRKRVYNFAVVGYSGEAYLCLWGGRQRGLNERAVLLAVKDSNILSALASNALTVLLVGAMAYTGQLKEIASASPGVEIYFFAGAGLAGFLVAAVAYFRRQVLTAPPDDTRFVLGIHFTRLLFVQTLLAAQYAVAIPGTPITAWLMFLAAQLVLDRIPLLPNKDLLFVGL
ncbi:MAG: hypothetical protein AAF869_07255, partial [Pseudomonadota bacterium]